MDMIAREEVKMKESMKKNVEYLDWYFTCDDGTADKEAQKAWFELRERISSGIIIPNVEIPKNCHECDSYGISDIVGLKCPCDANKELYSYDKRPEECPLKLI